MKEAKFRHIPNRLILIIALVVSFIANIYILLSLNATGPEDTYKGEIANISITYGAAVVEFVLHCFPEAKILRGSIFAIGVPLGTVVYSCSRFKEPAFLPGSLASFIAAFFCLIIFSYNWLTACISQIICQIATTIYISLKFTSSPAGNTMVGTMINYNLSFCFLPFLFYFLEKENRETLFANWSNEKEMKFWKKLANNLQVGLLVSIGEELMYYNELVPQVLLGPKSHKTDLLTVSTLLKQIKSVRDDTQSLFGAILGTEEKCHETGGEKYTYKAENNEETHFAAAFLNLRKRKANCKVCILQDLKVIEELEREQIKNQYQKNFLAMITHELRNPLHGIMGALEILKDSITAAELLHYCDLGLNTSKLMMSLVNDILDISQLEANKLKLIEERFLPLTAAQECIDIMKFQFEKKKLFLHLNAGTCLVPITNDKRRYTQIIINLLSNAVKFTSSGGVTVDLELDENSKFLTTIIKDTGKGMEHTDLGKLFQMYERLNTTASNPQGVGLGLTICKKLTEQMGGEIFVESVINEGSTFRFTVQNRSSGEEEKKETIKDTEENKCSLVEIIKKKRAFSIPPEASLNFAMANAIDSVASILVIDDDAGSFAILKHLCGMFSLPVDSANSGEEGVQAAETRLAKGGNDKAYKLFFIDMYMPGISGIEAATIILADYKEKGIACTIIGLSGDSNEDLKEKCKQVGIKDMLLKPFGKKEVKKILDSYFY